MEKSVWDIGPYCAWAAFLVLVVIFGALSAHFDIDWWWLLLGGMAITCISLALRSWDYNRARHTSVTVRTEDTNA